VPGKTASFRLGGDTVLPVPPPAPVALPLTANLGAAERFHLFLRSGDERRTWGFAPETTLVPKFQAAPASGPPTINALLAARGDVRYVWRHLPLTDVHPDAQAAAESAEAAAAQGAFWEMHDLLISNSERLTPADLRTDAERLGLDLERFEDDLRRRRHAGRVRRDVASADASGVAGTPTFFINGRRHQGPYDIDALSAAVSRVAAAARDRRQTS